MSGYLDDIITDILLRLPVKSLLRFRCVCKTWRAVIDTNYFVKQHLSHSTETHSKHKLILQTYSGLYYLGLYSPTDHPVKLVHPSNPNRLVTTLLGSCNGLLCLMYTNLIIIWNPATRKHVKLPPYESSLVKRDLIVVNCILAHGFGYDSISDDYKMVILLQIFFTEDNSFQTETEVYSLRSSSWRVIEDFPDYLIVDKKVPGALACGVLHWIAEKHDLKSGSSSCLVAAFDLVTEKHMVLTLPDLPEYKVSSLLLSELGGCLSIVCDNFKVGGVDVWVMKDYGVRESWTKLLTLSYSDIISSIDRVIPLAYSESGDEVLLMLNSDKIWYNLEKRTIKFTDVCGLPKFFYTAIWLESLVSLGNKAENDKKQGGEKQVTKRKREEKFLSAGFKLVL